MKKVINLRECYMERNPKDLRKFVIFTPKAKLKLKAPKQVEAEKWVSAI